MFYLGLFNAEGFAAKVKGKNGYDDLANKSSARKLLEQQILTDYWDNNSEMDVNVDVLLLKFNSISTLIVYLHI